ncbi:MAG: LamG-like jellyroll fold domain-containing protein, partial [Bacteroidota bacterium]
TSTEWTSSEGTQVEFAGAYENFILGGEDFAGTFAGVRIWNRALSISEAKTLSLSENKNGLISDWRITEGKGNYLYDNMSENHGLSEGGKWVDSPQSQQPGQFQFYIDGSPLYPMLLQEETHEIQGQNQLTIGGIKSNDGFETHFKGAIEEVRIWNSPRTNEQITDNAFGRLKGEWEQLLANYTFDSPSNKNDVSYKVQDSSLNSIDLEVHNREMLREVLSTAPIATEIPQVRSALTGVLTAYNGYIHARPGVVEYGDVQKNEDGTINGILKRCYSFIDKEKKWNRMTGYKVGNLVSQWYGQAQFAPQVMGYLEGPPPVPSENFPIGKDGDVDTYAYKLNNSVAFNQAEEVSYNYSTSKEAGWNVAVESELQAGSETRVLVAPLGFGISVKMKAKLAADSHWYRAHSFGSAFRKSPNLNQQLIWLSF